MATTISTQDIIDAKRDIDDIGKAVNENTIVSPRYGEDFKSLPMISAEFQISSDAAEAAAVSAAESADIAQDSAAIAELAATAATIGGNVYNTPEAGVDPVSGVADGAYFNVRSSNNESYVDEYQNVGGVPTPTGKSYPSSVLIDVLTEKTDEVDAKLKRENISVLDFFTPSEKADYKANPTTFDAYRPLQAFFDYIRLNDVGTAYCPGVFRTSQTIKCGLSSASLTKTVVGDLTLYALNAMDFVFDAQTGSDFTWIGSIKVYGTGDGNYSTRTCRGGIKLGGNADRTTWGLLRAQYFYELGVQFYNKTTMANVSRIRAFDCGSGYEPGSGTTDFCLRSSYTHNSNTGSSASASQRSVLNVDVLPPTDIETNTYVVINNRAYWVSAVDRTNSRITVFPWVDSGYLSGNLRYIFGAGVDVNGGDASVLNLAVIDTMRCGVAYSSRTLYPATVGVLTTQANAVALSVGSRTDSASVGGCINQLYTELNNFDIFPLSRGVQNFEILNTTALNYSKINYFAPRTSANLEVYSFYGLTGFIIGGINGFQMLSKPPRNTNLATIIKLSAPTVKHIHRKANSVFNLTYEQNLNDAFGYDATELTVIGTASNNIPTQVTFNPDSGRTVNGKASEVFSGFGKIPTFGIFYDIATNNYVVVNNSEGLPQTSVTYDPPSIPANATEATTVTLAGSSVGDIVQAAFSRYNADIEVSAVVSSANTVTVKFKNTSAAPIDLASGTLKVKLV